MGKLRTSSPCKGCSDRHVYCHASCLEYIEYQETAEMIRQRRGEERKTQEDFVVVVTSRFRHR